MEDYEGIVVSRGFRDLIFQEHAPERKQLCVKYVDNADSLIINATLSQATTTLRTTR
jgi:hypothetical protein